MKDMSKEMLVAFVIICVLVIGVVASLVSTSSNKENVRMYSECENCSCNCKNEGCSAGYYEDVPAN